MASPAMGVTMSPMRSSRLSPVRAVPISGVAWSIVTAATASTLWCRIGADRYIPANQGKPSFSQ